MFSLVDDDCLNVNSEDLVLESIIKWIDYVKCKPCGMLMADSNTSETQPFEAHKNDICDTEKSKTKQNLYLIFKHILHKISVAE